MSPRSACASSCTYVAMNIMREPHVVRLWAFHRTRLALRDAPESSAPNGILRSRHSCCSVSRVVSACCRTCEGTREMYERVGDTARGRCRPMRSSTVWWRVRSNAPRPAARPRPDGPPPGAIPRSARPSLSLPRQLPAALWPVARPTAAIDDLAAARPTAPAAAAAAVLASCAGDAACGTVGATPSTLSRAEAAAASDRPAATATAAAAMKLELGGSGTVAPEVGVIDKAGSTAPARTTATASGAGPT